MGENNAKRVIRLVTILNITCLHCILSSLIVLLYDNNVLLKKRLNTKERIIVIYVVGRRAFLVAGARWNELPVDIASAPSLHTFRKRLKLHLFPLSYFGLVL